MIKSKVEKYFIDNISIGYHGLFEVLDFCLSQSAKEFYVIYKGKEYCFKYSFDHQEIRKIKRERHKFIRMLILDCMKLSVGKNMTHRNNAWNAIYGIMGGADLKDHQFEKIQEQLLENIFDEHGKPIKSISLNMDNYQVKENLGILNVK